MGRPAATIPLAPRIPMFGSAMCIDQTRPRFEPPPLAISSANMPSGPMHLDRQWPWPRWGEVITSAGQRGRQGAEERRGGTEGGIRWQLGRGEKRETKKK